MNIGIFVPNVGNFGAKGYYNSQEVGLAKDLSTKCSQVVIFKLVKNSVNINEEIIKSNCRIIYIPAKHIGVNGIVKDFNLIKKYEIDKLVCFSDIQILVSKLYKYCKKNNISFIPYIGTIESNSSNKLVKVLMNIIARRNIRIYKECNYIMVKTPYIHDKLVKLGIKNMKLSPVGLDFELMNDIYDNEPISKIKSQLGFDNDKKIILFIGRLEEQKNPLLAVEILKEILKHHKNYCMVIIGKGTLREQLIKKISDENLKENIKYIEEVKNKDIWKYYVSSECFINLNSEEIFGMAILEAMFYRCPVVALCAPGPNFIIKDGENGILIEKMDIDKFVLNIINSNDILCKIRMKSKLYIKENFSWMKCADNVLNGESYGK